MEVAPGKRSQVARYDDCAVMPWRNGRGTTRLLRPPGEGSDAWWVSVADLVTPGPFSAFPGVDRIFTPVGAAVELTIDGGVREVVAGQPLAFRGEAEVTLALPEGPARALNVFVNRSCCCLVVQVRTVRGQVDPQGALVLLEGTAHLSDGRHLGVLDLAQGPAEVDGVIITIGVAAATPARGDDETH